MTGDAIAKLLERLAEARGLAEACSVVLDRVAAGQAPVRALVVVRRESGVHGAGWGIAEPTVQAVLARAGEAPLADWLERDAPALQHDVDLLPGCSTLAVLPFFRHDPDTRAVVLLETARLDPLAERIHAVFGRCGAAVVRSLELEVLRARVQASDRERGLLVGAIDVLSDPVLLTDAANDILLANRRAEQLFSATADDSEGRRRALQINNLLLSSFLTQSVIGADRSAARELNLVDPSDGSDLLFEVLSAPLGGPPSREATMMTVLRDITDLKLAVAELEQQSRRFRAAEYRARQERDRLNAIIGNVDEPILVTDSGAKIILMNREAERLFEAPAHGMGAGLPASNVRANDTKFTSAISKFLLQPDQRRIETLELTDPVTGTAFPVEAASSKILDDHGDPLAIVSVLHDMTQVVENQRLAWELRELNEGLEQRIVRATAELEAHNRQLEWQRRELERASRLKSEFLANMSHELRTPLNVLLGYAALLRDGVYGGLTERQAGALEKMHTASTHLLQLINDILDLSKIEAGRMTLHAEEVPLGEVFAELAEMAEPLLVDKPLRFVVEADEALPPLRTDRTRLKQVLFNLVSNAVKFTDSGSVEVRAKAVAGGRRVQILVADTGVGIRPEDLGIIFEDFRQVDQSTTKRHGGTGLGLSITRKVVGLLGGTIAVESAIARGTTFTVELPLADPADRPAGQIVRGRERLERAGG